MISDADVYEDNQGMQRIPDDDPPNLRQSLEMMLTEEERSEWNENYERARQNNVWKRKQRRVRELLDSLNNLSAAFFAAISVLERQIAVLQDLHGVLLAGSQTETKNYEKRYPLRRNPFHNRIVPTPVLSENSEQICPGALDTIDEVVRERKCSIQKIKELVENTEIRRKFVQPSHQNS